MPMVQSVLWFSFTQHGVSFLQTSLLISTHCHEPFPQCISLHLMPLSIAGWQKYCIVHMLKCTLCCSCTYLMSCSFHSLSTRFGTVAVPNILLFQGAKPMARFNQTERTLETLTSFITNQTGMSYSFLCVNQKLSQFFLC